MPDRTAAEQLDDLAEVDAQGRVGRTAVQVGIPAAIVVIGTWVAGLAGVDLDPGPGRDMPANVVTAWTATVAVALAWLMNRRRS